MPAAPPKVSSAAIGRLKEFLHSGASRTFVTVLPVKQAQRDVSPAVGVSYPKALAVSRGRRPIEAFGAITDAAVCRRLPLLKEQ
jgi:hypothetical protein